MIRTKGNVEVDKIKIGDVHYEFEHPFFVKVEVIELPKEVEPGFWIWRAKNTLNENQIITYSVRVGFEHYGPNLYDHESYRGCRQV